MALCNNCNVPEDLYYWPEKHVWARPEADGTVTVGITDAAQHLAGGIVTATPKEAGKPLKKSKSAGTVESGKWVGPVTAPLSGTIVAANPEVKARPSILNADPYAMSPLKILSGAPSGTCRRDGSRTITCTRLPSASSRG